MGLDMYLKRNVYIANYAHDPEGQKVASAVLEALGVKDKSGYADGSISIELPAAYWRKANAIHGWFVENVQDGEDDCNSYEVTREQLTTLRDLCSSILAGTAPKEAMPPTEGFFFGNTSNDEYYRADLQDTVTKLTAVLEAPSISKYDSFQYQSSW